MTERLFWTPEEPHTNLSIDVIIDGHIKIELKKTNSAVHSYLGTLALYNHIRFTGDGNDPPILIFNSMPQHAILEKSMIQLGYPHFKDQEQIDSTDVVTYEQFVKNLDRKTLEEIVEDWSTNDQSSNGTIDTLY